MTPNPKDDLIKKTILGMKMVDFALNNPEVYNYIRQQTAQEIFNHKSKFLDIRHCEDNTVIYNKKGEELGTIYYEPDWKKYVFEIQGFIFDFDCLLAITSELFNLLDDKIKQKYLGDEK